MELVVVVQTETGGLASDKPVPPTESHTTEEMANPGLLQRFFIVFRQ